ncbi:gamma-glutamylcyclotransferase [Bartonella tamiae]|uniref:glutathione-specific gamma-glutamylcyclotransferase n=1 Tax=Bartonella tamiae Th239 TaxID=1094558 RepID=J0QZG9_9HYPH|nr:gamma-glutamylcyclotransferase [Bartonella tamiae]EJF91541.1 hypothetical protein ME5_00236 [Bartonella tamiae Th239]EJF92475.1 hypothetical protein MEG_01645 [Bartonella tamiae Th307]
MMNDFWVFGYGSLMWNPGFIFDKQVPARLYGYHRSLCIYSHFYRGTPDKPGLVFGLAKGGCCNGLAFHIPKKTAKATYEYLLEREQINNVYNEKQCALYTKLHKPIEALVFVANPHHAQYAGGLSLHDKLTIIDKSNGEKGSTRDYVLNTLKLLKQNGIKDKALTTLEHALVNDKILN